MDKTSQPPQKPVDYAETELITAILEGKYLAGASLPAERELASQLGITRPTLREALQRLERDGWITIQQGKPTTVNDFWWEGGMNILAGIVRYSKHLPPEFPEQLLRVRLDLAPSFTQMAIERAPNMAIEVLEESLDLEDTPEAFAAYDWRLQRRLTVICGNPIYALIFNSFTGFYEQLARGYFSLSEARESSREFYAALLEAAKKGDLDEAERLTREVMQKSIEIWWQISAALEGR